MASTSTLRASRCALAGDDLHDMRVSPGPRAAVTRDQLALLFVPRTPRCHRMPRDSASVRGSPSRASDEVVRDSPSRRGLIARAHLLGRSWRSLEEHIRTRAPSARRRARPCGERRAREKPGSDDQVGIVESGQVSAEQADSSRSSSSSRVRIRGADPAANGPLIMPPTVRSSMGSSTDHRHPDLALALRLLRRVASNRLDSEANAIHTCVYCRHPRDPPAAHII